MRPLRRLRNFVIFYPMTEETPETTTFESDYLEAMRDISEMIRIPQPTPSQIPVNPE